MNLTICDFQKYCEQYLHHRLALNELLLYKVLGETLHYWEKLHHLLISGKPHGLLKLIVFYP